MAERKELFSRIQEAVFLVTNEERQHQLKMGVDPKHAQEVYEEYDPVVYLATMSVNRHLPIDIRKDCAKEVAQYTYPKLKSIEVIEDQASAAEREETIALAMQLVDILDNKSAAARREYEAEEAGDADGTN